MKKILALLMSLIIFSATIQPAHALIMSAGDFSASGSEWIGSKDCITLYSYTAPSGKSVVRFQGTINTDYGYNSYWGTFDIYGASGNLIAECSLSDNDRDHEINVEFNEPSITIKATAIVRDFGLDWNATISIGGDVADNATVIEARNAANAAKTSADTAAAGALNSYNAVSNTNGNTITAVRDASGTVLSEARQAKTNSQNAYNEAHSASTKIDSLNTAINNIAYNIGVDKTPPDITIKTASGAMATSGSSIRAVLDITDFGSTTFTYSLNNLTYSPVPADKIITLPVSSPGTNVISVWVKDSDGNIGTTSIAVRKL